MWIKFQFFWIGIFESIHFEIEFAKLVGQKLQFETLIYEKDEKTWEWKIEIEKKENLKEKKIKM